MTQRASLATLVLSLSLALSSCSSAAVETELAREQVAEVSKVEELALSPTFELSELGVDSNFCKFEDQSPGFRSRDPWMDFTYFPNMQADPYFLPSIGQVEIGLVFLDWEDKPGSDNDRDYYLKQAEIMANWYQLISQEKFSINWHVSDRWGRLPGSWKDMKRGSQQSDAERDPVANQVVLDAAVAATDHYFDYTELDYVIFAVPKSGTLTERGAEVGDVVFYAGIHGFESHIHPNPDWHATSVNTNEGAIGNWALAGTTFQDTENRSPSWVFWAHEMGHMFGYVSHSPQPGVEDNGPGGQYFVNPMTSGGIFAHQWTPVRAVSGWTSWVAGWLDDDQIQCVDAADIEDEVFAVNNRRKVDGAIKAVIIRTGDTTGLVIESREWDSLIDAPTEKGESGFYDGIFMYYIDSTRRISDMSLLPLLPHGTGSVWDEDLWPGLAKSSIDSMFQEGESADYQDFTIEVLSLQDGVDYVRVRRSTASR